MHPVKDHPNATTAGGSGLGAVLVILAAHKLGWTGLNDYEGAAIATGVSTVAVAVGREGLVGIARRLWRGDR